MNQPETTSGADLTGRVALVTGCGQADGIGAAIARTLHKLGAVVVVTGRTLAQGQSDDLDALADELGTNASSLAVRGDVVSAADCARMVKAAEMQFGRLDILVNNASAGHGGDRLPIAKVQLADWQRVLDINLTGPFLMAQAAFPLMSAMKWGRIINISSVAALKGYVNRTAYCASKAGLLGLTRALAAEGGPVGITANAICPGMIVTRRTVSTATRQGRPAEEVIAERAKSMPVQRAGNPADIASLVAYFASPGTGFMTGQVATVDGGNGTLITNLK